MSVLVELKHLLLEVLPSPAMVAQGRLLCIQNHLDMVRDSLWAINSMIIIPKMRGLYNMSLRSEGFEWVLAVPVEFANWEIDVAATVVDVGELLDRILNWEASSHHSITGNIQQVRFRHAILEELKEMLCGLNSLEFRGSAMGLRRDPMSSMNPLQEDYSTVLKNEVVDREEDLEKLIVIFQQQQQLVPFNNNGDDNNPFAIVIVGKRGVGKTTLAHMIYNHTWVRQQFHHRIWVDLPSSWPFKMMNIIEKEFTRSISNEEYSDQKLQLEEQPLQAIWKNINEQLDGSRYLLVLHCEDLTSLMQQEWDELKNILLRVGGPGSAILVILKSSTELVCDMGFLNGMKNITTYCLNPISVDAWWELFKRHAATTIPSKQDKSEKDELVPFQNLIHQPFWAKIVGSLNHDDVQATFPAPLPVVPKAYYSLVNSRLVNMRIHQYRHLLGNAMKDYEILSDALTSEYLIPTEMFELGWIFSHDITEEILEFLNPRMVSDLRMKVPEDSSIPIPKCCRYLCLEINPREILFRLPTMPVEVSYKLITLILQEDQKTTREDVEEITLQVYKKRRMKAATAISKFLNTMLVRFIHLRILVVETSMIQSLPSEVSKLVNLRYLHLSKLNMEVLLKSLFDLSNLRILSLYSCTKLQKIPERIYKLKKLEILRLVYCTKLQQLPKSTTRLQNLFQLDVGGCCWLRELPEDLVSFKSLRYLEVEGCKSLSQIPRGIDQLVGLRSLSGISVDADGGFGFAQLQALTNLQHLSLRNLERVEETQTEMLMGQQRLLILSLHWGGEEANDSSESATPLQVLEALRPNKKLQMLHIISYMGVEFPIWMSKQQFARFDSLVEVILINLKRCATLPSLGQLPYLKVLEISGMDLIKHIDDIFYGDSDIFPNLLRLTFSEMLALEKWSAPKRKNAKSFPQLQLLRLIQCPKFKEIYMFNPDSSFSTISVWLNNQIIWSPEFYGWNNLQCIRMIEIVGCEELRRLPQGMRSLKRLTIMTINSCNNLATLITLDSLKVLNIYACPVLAFNLEAFTKLSQLKITGCPKMKSYHDAWKKKDDERRRAKEKYDNASSSRR